MSRKAETKATFLVTLTIPVGSNAHEAQQYLRDVISSGDGSSTGPYAKIDECTVALKQKVTTYGN